MTPNAPNAHLNYLWFDDKMELEGLTAEVSRFRWLDIFVHIDNQRISQDVWLDNLR